MNSETLQQVMSKISIAAQSGNLAEVERLTPIATRLRQLIDQKQLLAKEEEELVERVSSPNFRPTDGMAPSSLSTINNGHRITRRATRGGLCVEMDLRGSGKVRLEEKTAAETMVVAMERLLAEFGVEVFEKLQNVRTGRGPLVSRRPQIDFLNPKKGEPYAHRRVPGTDFYVLTHSATSEKVEDFQRALRLIGLPSTAFRVFRTGD